MTNVLLNNSFNVLGLENSSTEKEILRRSKEIINLIKIEETPEYDLDIWSTKDQRTERNVKEALQNLSEPKKRIREYFFWFDIQDVTDKEAISNIRNKKYSKAISIWKEGIKKESPKVFFYKKNLAILDSILLSFEGDSNDYLKASLNLWKEIIKSDKFWESYIKSYKLNDNLGTSTVVIEDFKSKVLNYLSDIYTQSSQISGKNYHAEFAKTFGVKGERLERDILNPIYNNINDAVVELEAMNITEDGIVDKKEAIKIRTLIKKFQEELNKIITLGQYEDSQTKLIRDRAASAIRKTVLDIYNNLRDTERSMALLKIALKISGTAGMMNKVEQDIKTLEKNKKDDEIVDPILELIKAEKWEEALALIQVQEKKYTNNSSLLDFYKNHKKYCIALIAAKKYKQATASWDQKNFDKGRELYEEIISLITPNLNLYNFNKTAVNETIEDIKVRVTQLTSNNLDQLDAFRDEIIKLVNEKFEGQMESSVLIYYIDSYIFSLATDFMKKARRNSTWKNWLGWVVVIVVISLFSSDSSNNNNSSIDCSNVSPGQYCCSNEDITAADNLKPDYSSETELQNRFNEIERERQQLDLYNQYAVNAFNNKVDQYTLDADVYNNKQTEYNNFLKQNCILK